ncbi:MAG: hypothetical protein V3R82_01280, partial [Candidatus Hydrothermarchaeales archaeon]
VLAGPFENPPASEASETAPLSNRSRRSAGPGQPLTLADLEAIALANNPTLSQASARASAAWANAFQAGLWRNPVLSYQGPN